jgi:hypothetical protein
MGAKAVMTMALRNPDCCANIIPVDNAPVDAALSSDFPKYAEGMQHVERSQPKSQREADKLIEPYAKDLPVRQFLLTNLMRGEPGAPLKFRIPVSILTKALDNMADFPFTNPDETSFSKRALFIRGTKSHYVSDETLPIIGRFFPRFELVDIDCGHWVISEKPEEFIKGTQAYNYLITNPANTSQRLWSSCRRRNRYPSRIQQRKYHMPLIKRLARRIVFLYVEQYNTQYKRIRGRGFGNKFQLLMSDRHTYS